MSRACSNASPRGKSGGCSTSYFRTAPGSMAKWCRPSGNLMIYWQKRLRWPRSLRQRIRRNLQILSFGWASWIRIELCALRHGQNFGAYLNVFETCSQRVRAPPCVLLMQFRSQSRLNQPETSTDKDRSQAAALTLSFGKWPQSLALGALVGNKVEFRRSVMIVTSLADCSL